MGKKSLRDVDSRLAPKSSSRYQPTIPQTIMRDEMTTLGAVFDEVVGTFDQVEEGVNTLSVYGQKQARATEIVYDIIDQHELVLSLKQWHVVQRMMEQAVMTGVQLERDMPG